MKISKKIKELSDYSDARDNLISKGYIWQKCHACKGISITGFEHCGRCNNEGGYWMAPMMGIYIR